TPRGERQTIGAVRTLRPVLSGEELLVRYGDAYWRYHAAAPKRKRGPRRAAGAQRQMPAAALAQMEQQPAPAATQPPAAIAETRRRARDLHFEKVLVTTLASV